MTMRAKQPTTVARSSALDRRDSCTGKAYAGARIGSDGAASDLQLVLGSAIVEVVGELATICTTQ
jgi:hypothetical protein